MPPSGPSARSPRPCCAPATCARCRRATRACSRLELEDEAGRASALQKAVSGALEAGRWYRPEKRPFWPHLTLARVKRGERRVPGLAGPPAPGGAFRAAQLTLYRSTLRPQGALYEPLGRTTCRTLGT